MSITALQVYGLPGRGKGGIPSVAVLEFTLVMTMAFGLSLKHSRPTESLAMTKAFSFSLKVEDQPGNFNLIMSKKMDFSLKFLGTEDGPCN